MTVSASEFAPGTIDLVSTCDLKETRKVLSELGQSADDVASSGPSRQAAFFGPTVANGALRTWLDLQLAPPSRD